MTNPTEPTNVAEKPKNNRRIQEYVKTFWSTDITPIIFQNMEAMRNKGIIRLDTDSSYELSVIPRHHLLWLVGDRRFVLWNGRYFAECSTADNETGPFARLIACFLGQQFEISLRQAMISEIQKAVIRQPLALYSSALSPQYVALLNDEAYDLREFATVPCTPNFPILRTLDADQKHFRDPTPHFDKLLTDAFPDEPEMRQLIIEMLGYYMIPHDEEPACFFLFGAAASGKSTLLNLLKELIGGEQFISALSLHDITTDKFMAATLAGKVLNLYDEDESTHVDLGKLKLLISHGQLEVQRKFEQAFKLTPYAKFIFASNQLPQFTSVDQGIMRRIYLIEFKHSVPMEKRDKFLMQKLRAEFSGIVGKCLQAALSFVERGQRFEVPPQVEEAKKEFQRDNNPVLGFIEEHYVASPPGLAEANKPVYGMPSHYWIPNNDLYEDYKKWIAEKGQKPYSSLRFFKVLSLERQDILQGRFGTAHVRYRGLVKRSEAAKLIPSQQQY